ncbi:hypothetical protein IC617_08345 [Neiella sp. HB171785]|uniref:Uncharacterized protein n=1 Tax=Neiella litorisoli TaxID=2771431 RepID=A0A8J6QRM3_9GAMM|nr:hypothetical protein [Neiella litorisoli]MBD1389434.1 hypothetical protein [Neiella litorisoli]
MSAALSPQPDAFPLPFSGTLDAAYVAPVAAPWYEAMTGAAIRAPSKRVARTMGIRSESSEPVELATPYQELAVLRQSEAIAKLCVELHHASLLGDAEIDAVIDAEMGTEAQRLAVCEALSLAMEMLQTKVAEEHEKVTSLCLSQDVSLSDDYSQWLNQQLMPHLIIDSESYGSVEHLDLRIVHPNVLAACGVEFCGLSDDLKLLVYQSLQVLRRYNCMSMDTDHVGYFLDCDEMNGVVEALGVTGCTAIGDSDEDETRILAIINDYAEDEYRDLLEAGYDDEDIAYRAIMASQYYLEANKPWAIDIDLANQDERTALQGLQQRLEQHQTQADASEREQAAIDALSKVLKTALIGLTASKAHDAIESGASDIWLGDGRIIGTSDLPDIFEWLNEGIMQSGEYPAASLNLAHPQWLEAINHFILADVLVCYLSDTIA